MPLSPKSRRRVTWLCLVVTVTLIVSFMIPGADRSFLKWKKPVPQLQSGGAQSDGATGNQIAERRDAQHAEERLHEMEEALRKDEKTRREVLSDTESDRESLLSLVIEPLEEEQISARRRELERITHDARVGGYIDRISKKVTLLQDFLSFGTVPVAGDSPATSKARILTFMIRHDQNDEMTIIEQPASTRRDNERNRESGKLTAAAELEKDLAAARKLTETQATERYGHLYDIRTLQSKP